MNPHTQLDYETQVRPRSAAVAAGAALFLVAAAAAQLSWTQAKVPELTLGLITTHKRGLLEILGAVLQGIAIAGLVWTLSFLFGVVRARRPEMVPATRIVVIVAGVVSAVGGIIYAAVIVSKAADFVAHGTQSYDEARQLTQGALLPVLQTLDIFAQFALAVGLLLIAFNAMRVGVLTRGMGYLGMFTGAAGLLLIGSPPALLIEVFWLAGLAVLFFGRWPGGDPPSWRSGRAEPWPSSQQLREQRRTSVVGKAAAGSSDGTRGNSARAGSEEPPAAVPEPQAPARTRSSTPKRKRKRRR